MQLKLAALWLLLSPALFGQFEQTAHPRLWVNEAREQELRQIIGRDPLAAGLHQSIIKEADAILERRTCEHIIRDGRRLLPESRLAQHQIMHCAWAWRFTNEAKYRDRAIKELSAACTMKDWNPAHFLDVAEMAAAVAIGYDWLHADLSPKQREMCEKAIQEKALKPADTLLKQNVWWKRGSNNWSQVCGAGIAVAAIALQGKDQGLSAGLIRDGLEMIKKSERFYEPDGIYPEGPGYWHYGTNYHVMLLAACEELDHPASMPPKFEQSGNSMIHLYGPTRLPFNFADGHATVSGISPAQTWIASHYNNALQSTVIREVIGLSLDPDNKSVKRNGLPFILMWLPDPQPQSTPVPVNAVFQGNQPVAVFRTDWSEDAAWLAVKGGTPDVSHGHMDVGSFCYDAHGTRWIHDLGSDDYNMPDYFKELRFTYYRMQNRSHNTLEINGGLQIEKCEPCPIIASSVGDEPHATFDLSAAYADQAERVIRKVDFNPQTGSARIRDEITKPKGEVIWRIITDAACEIREDSVILRKKGQSIRLQQPGKQGRWSVDDATPPLEIENANKGYRAVSLRVAAQEKLIIEVEIQP